MQLQAQGIPAGASATMRRAANGVNTGRRLGVAPHSAPQPVGSWTPTTIAWTSALFGHTLSVSHTLLCLARWVARSSVGGQVARRLPGRHSSVAARPRRCKSVRCRSGLFIGAQYLGKTATLVPSRWSFCPQAQVGHFGRLVGTATPLQGHRRLGPVRASAHLSQVLVGAGVTPAVHSHGPAPSAPAVSFDRKGAHGRVNSDSTVDRPCSRLIRPQDRIPARHPGAHVLPSPRRQAARPVGSGALVVRSRPPRPASAPRTRSSP